MNKFIEFKCRCIALAIMTTVTLSGCADNYVLDGLPVDLEAGNFARVEITGRINEVSTYVVSAVNGKRRSLFKPVALTYALPANQPLEFHVKCSLYGDIETVVVNSDTFRQTLSPNKCYVPSGLPKNWVEVIPMVTIYEATGERFYETEYRTHNERGKREAVRFCGEVRLEEVDCATHPTFEL
ncbi:hypothetical protein I3271_03225 [Photobacterium leiognathi]|uniref:hypothetical protein n=1 Tax=Photobacterium leiognathi TaxID=553611 RepID=UPI001EDE0EF1|nr:hypothetical protein [Photobacterium leiognathi]MCG3883694.1 hypothetical protein [Photobacterium leiognathi]